MVRWELICLTFYKNNVQEHRTVLNIDLVPQWSVDLTRFVYSATEIKVLKEKLQPYKPSVPDNFHD